MTCLQGATVGALTGFVFGLWVVIGSFYSSAQWAPMPSTIANCSAEVFSNVTAGATSVPFTASTVEYLVDVASVGMKL